MNRDILLYRLCPIHRIYDCCNSDTNFNCVDCTRVMNEWLDGYDKQIRAEAIEEFARELHKGCNEMIKQTWGSNTAPISWAEAYADFKVDIDEIAKQLKEQK